MRLKTFTANELHRALGMVRRELGEDAVIVSTQDLPDGGVQIMAAVDDDNVYSNDDFLAKVLTSSAVNSDGYIDGDSFANNTNIPEELRTDPFKILDDLGHLLSYHRVPNEINERLLSFAAESRTARNHIDLLCELFKFSPIDFSSMKFNSENQGIVLLVGQPGVGKSLASAKLAFEAISSGKSVHVISCDHLKAGAINQLFSYTKALNMKLSVAKSANELRMIIGARKKYDVLIIDTPGINPFSERDMIELAEYVVAAHRLPTLVFPANIDVYECMDTIDQFQVIGARKCIVTRIDTSRRLGSIIAAGFEKKMGISFFGNGPTLGDRLIRASSNSFYNLLKRHDIDAYKNISTPARRKMAL